MMIVAFDGFENQTRIPVGKSPPFGLTQSCCLRKESGFVRICARAGLSAQGPLYHHALIVYHGAVVGRLRTSWLFAVLSSGLLLRFITASPSNLTIVRGHRGSVHIPGKSSNKGGLVEFTQVVRLNIPVPASPCNSRAA